MPNSNYRGRRYSHATHFILASVARSSHGGGRRREEGIQSPRLSPKAPGAWLRRRYRSSGCRPNSTRDCSYLEFLCLFFTDEPQFVPTDTCRVAYGSEECASRMAEDCSQDRDLQSFAAPGRCSIHPNESHSDRSRGAAGVGDCTAVTSSCYACQGGKARHSLPSSFRGSTTLSKTRFPPSYTGETGQTERISGCRDNLDQVATLDGCERAQCQGE